MPPYTIETWRADHNSGAFVSGMAVIDHYIKHQAARDMSSRASLVFVLTEPGDRTVRGYYTLSSLGIVFTDLPETVTKRLPRYPQIGATILGRLSVDRSYRDQLEETLGENPRLGELLLFDAQMKALQGARKTAGSALFVIDVKQPTAEELACGLLDPMTFYTQYGFAPLPGNRRRVFKLIRVIEQEFRQA